MAIPSPKYGPAGLINFQFKPIHHFFKPLGLSGELLTGSGAFFGGGGVGLDDIGYLVNPLIYLTDPQRLLSRGHGDLADQIAGMRYSHDNPLQRSGGGLRNFGAVLNLAPTLSNWRRLTASVACVPSPTLVIWRSLPSEPIDTVLGRSATEPVPKATLLFPLALAFAPYAALPLAVARALLPTAMVFSPLATALVPVAIPLRPLTAAPEPLAML
jgi:hypothetical protein